MLKLRVLLLHNYLYYIVLFISIIYLIISSVNAKTESIYKNQTKITGVITKIDVEDYGIKLYIKNKESIIGYFYTDDINNFVNNYNLGDRIKINYEYKKIPNNTVENTFNYKKYLLNKKIYMTIEIKEIELLTKNKNIFYKFKQMLITRTYKLEKSYSYINSLLLGNNNYIDDDINDSYRENGISHLFAISGSHISILILGLDFFLKKIKVKENKRYYILIIFLLLFMFITNFSPSVLRAGLFAILVFINKRFYFYISSINILLLSLSILIFINPFLIYDIGFQYSFLISFGLIIMSDYINSKKGYIKKLFITSLISFIISIPITIYNFYQLNFLSIIFNLFFVPYVSFIVLPMIIVAYIFPFLDNILYIFIIILEEISLILSKIDILKFIFCKPSMSIFVIYCVLIIVFLYGLKKKKIIPKMFLILLLFLNNIWILDKYNYLTFLDVGQGDCILLSVNDTYNLIDTGGIVMLSDSKYTYKLSKNKIIPYLKSKGIKKIDNLILTHGDSDHMGEAINLVNNFKVEKVIFNNGKYNDLEFKLIEVLRERNIPYYKNIKELNINNNKLYFLNNGFYDNENDNSNVIYIELNKTKLLLMGDASVKVEDDILKNHNLNNIDILKVGHHGSSTSSSRNFINIINPKYSIISVGENNRYNHPNRTVLDNLKNSIVYRTDKDGSIMFKFKDSKLEIATFAP